MCTGLTLCKIVNNEHTYIQINTPEINKTVPLSLIHQQLYQILARKPHFLAQFHFEANLNGPIQPVQFILSDHVLLDALHEIHIEIYNIRDYRGMCNMCLACVSSQLWHQSYTAGKTQSHSNGT